MTDRRVRVLLARGHHPTVFGLRLWEALPERFDVRYLRPRSTVYALEGVRMPEVPVTTARDRLPGPLGRLSTVPDRYVGIEQHLSAADVVHTDDMSFWFSAQMAREKRRHGYRLLVSVAETLPLLEAFRSPYARRYRAAVMEGADLFLPTTERARDALLLEGVEADRIVVAPLAVDIEPFMAAPVVPADEHVIVSAGRLEWEKGHHDVLRAFAALRRGLVPLPEGARPRLRLVGSGAERTRLTAHAEELGIADMVEFRSVPYSEMPELYASASAMVLASLPRSGCSLYPGDIPRCFWEEQFGLVLAEAMAAGLPLVVATSGAIPEVVGGTDAVPFAPGDWMTLAHALAGGPLRRPPGERIGYPPELVQRYSIAAAADRYAAACDRVLT